MRLPLALSARLARSRLLHASSNRLAPAIFHLSPRVKHFPAGHQRENVTPESEWHSPKACVQAATQAGAPAVWIGGTEPLFHPAIGDLTSALVENGRYVFVHTSGAGLRKRIHEFEPVDGFFFTLEIPADAGPPQSRAAADDSAPFAAVSEAIRVARLSGFHVCAHFTVIGPRATADLVVQMTALGSQGVDGMLVSSGGAFLRQPNAAKADRNLAEITRLIPVAGWRRFSRLLESSYEQAAALQEHFTRQGQETGPCEETA